MYSTRNAPPHCSLAAVLLQPDITYDARAGAQPSIRNWTTTAFDDSAWPRPRAAGDATGTGDSSPGAAPWGVLVERPIPQVPALHRLPLLDHVRLSRGWNHHHHRSLTSLIITHWTSSHCVASRAAQLTLTIHQFRRDATLQRFESLEVQTDADDGDGFRSLGKGGNPAHDIIW